MNVDIETLKLIHTLLDAAMDYEGDVFGCLHNEAVDVMYEIEQLLTESRELE